VQVLGRQFFLKRRCRWPLRRFKGTESAVLTPHTGGFQGIRDGFPQNRASRLLTYSGRQLESATNGTVRGIPEAPLGGMLPGSRLSGVKPASQASGSLRAAACQLPVYPSLTHAHAARVARAGPEQATGLCSLVVDCFRRIPSANLSFWAGCLATAGAGTATIGDGDCIVT
jgi:hypothetical protein